VAEFRLEQVMAAHCLEAGVDRALLASSAMVYSMMLTCRACGVEPHAWLLHVLTELPQRAPDADVSDLLPFNYVKQQAEASVS
ncbi:transposase domain-containing protein, partial [Burkholderia stagnalis]|uniref:transposase domain-containing protein n=1 Tax=Burkholderia stagnalis TaxID=1503054 RepID=UPI0021AB21D8